METENHVCVETENKHLCQNGNQQHSSGQTCSKILISLLQSRVSSEYIGGLVQTPDGQQAIAAAGDGHLTLLDMRKAGEKAAEVSCGFPLLCCQTDGQAVAAGTQAGQVT